MSNESRSREVELPVEVRLSRNTAEVFLVGDYTFKQYARVFTAGILKGDQSVWGQCFDTMPAGIDPRDYLSYLEEEVVAKDFEPYPHGLCFDTYSDDEIAMIKRELRPNYIALVAFARGRLSR